MTDPHVEKALAFQKAWYEIFDRTDEYFEVCTSAENMWDYAHKQVQRHAMLLFKDLLTQYGVTKSPSEPVLRACINSVVTVLLFRQKHDDEQYRALCAKGDDASWSSPPSEAVN